MIKHGEIIQQLSETQKLRLVTDFSALADEELNALGVPHVVADNLVDINERLSGGYPSFFGLANSWDKDYFSLIAADLTYRIGNAVNLIDTPPVRLKTSVYADGMSEDPYLNKTFAEGLCLGIESSGASACLTDCSVRAVDVAALDKNPDNAVISNLLLKPFLSVGQNGKATAIKCSPCALRRSWHAVGENIEKMLRGNVKDSVNIVFSGASQDVAVAAMAKDNELVCNTPLTALRAAIENYRRLKAEVERGSVSVGELNKAVADGVAVSEETLDSAVDNVLCFAEACARKRAVDPNNTELASALNAEETKRFGDLDKFRDRLTLLSVQESTVLLKNANVLPVSAAKLALIGELAESVPNLQSVLKSYCGENGCELTGYARGYSQDEERTDALLNEAVQLAQKASTVVMFMGLGKREKSLAENNSSLILPANQLELFDAISELGKNIIVVIKGDHLPDMQFDDYCGGVLFMPNGGARGAEAICNIMFGKFNPSGRLAFSGYDDTDGYHKTLRDYKVSGKNKVGQFIGYRHYTSNGIDVKYPFGFGLSYTKFEYSAIKAEENGVSIIVRNTGKVGGSEIVQLYIGKRDSSLIRSKRELKGFLKIYLKPKEKKRIAIPINKADLAVYDPSDEKLKIEGGEYVLYVGASCADIRLTATINIQGEKIAKSGDKLSDYLQGVSNIVDGGYMMSGGASKGAKRTKAQAVADFPYEKLFLDEFGLDVEQEEDYYEQEVVSLQDDDITKYVGDGITPTAFCDKLVDYFAARGIILPEPDARELTAAMVASRVLFICCEDKQYYADYANALSGFFGSLAAVQSVADIADSATLFADGSPTAELLHSSADRHDSVLIAALDDVSPAKLGEYFTPFIRYVGNPENNRITYGDNVSGEQTFTVGRNVWFLMRVSASDVADIPAHIADISTLIIPNISRCDGEEGVVEQVGVNYYKFLKAFERVEDKFELEESDWKRIDKLTSYVNSHSRAVIGNKMWLQMEKLSAAYLAAGGERDGALDVVVCDKLLELFAPLLRGKLTRDDGDFAQTLENIFGDDGVPESKTACGVLGLTVAL